MNTNKVVVFFAFLLAAGVGFAQGARGMGGGGISGQPIDGTTIKPKSVQASGTGDQFVCTNATAVCEVESSINATTMTSTVPAFDIGPTATPGANDRLACFSYGPSGSKTRMMCVDVEGDVSASGDVVISNPKRFCLNTSCTNNIKANATFADDFELTTGSVVRMSINSIGSTSFSATVGAAGLSSTGNINSSTASGNNAYTCTNVGCRLSLGNTGRYITDVGNGTWSLYAGLNVFSTLTADLISDANGIGPLNLTSSVPNGASAVGVVIRSTANYTTAGAKIASFRNTTSSEKAFVNKDGVISGDSFTATTASGSALTGGGASGPLLLTSNATDAATSGTVPAIKLQASVDITNSDLLMSVEDSANNRRMTLTEAGAANFAGSVTSSQFNSRYHTATTTPVEVGTTVSTAEVNPIQFSTSNTFTGDAVNFVSAFNGANQVFAFSKDGLLRVNKHNAAKPTCNTDNRGRIFFKDGVTGGTPTADVFEVCGKDASDVYSWKSIVTW